jgi:hypothetical protein
LQPVVLYMSELGGKQTFAAGAVCSSFAYSSGHWRHNY